MNDREQQNTGLFGNLLGNANVGVNVGLLPEHYVYLGLTIMVFMTLGFLFGGLAKQRLGLS